VLEATKANNLRNKTGWVLFAEAEPDDFASLGDGPLQPMETTPLTCVSTTLGLIGFVF